jgi:Zn-dependent protease
MGWEDRPYYRDRSRSTSPLLWLLSGSVPMFTAFGIRVRAHASLLIFIALMVIFDAGMGFSIEARAVSMAIFTAIIVLHEFGHCFMARWLGGTADDVMLTPLGGLAMASPPHRPLPTFLTVAAGPAVNVVLCAICALLLHSLGGHWVSLNPFHGPPMFAHWTMMLLYTWFVFICSYALLLFNLLPIFPLDGGQMLQAILWPQTGHYRSMMIATTTGMIGSAVLGLFALYHFMFWMLILAGFLFYGCYQRRMILRESGDEWSDQTDYSQSLYGNPQAPPKRRRNRRAANRARKIARQEAAERQQIDAILAKVSAKGMHALNWFERRTLRKATERQRRRNLELSRLQ